MSTFVTVVGLAAAVCTTAANWPLWVVYGVLKDDIIILLAIGISLALVVGLLVLKLQKTPH